MAATEVPLFAIQRALRDVMNELTQQAAAPPRWSELPEDALWRELVACILGSRVRFSTAYAAVGRLAAANLLDASKWRKNFCDYEKALTKILAASTTPHPFSRVKAQQIRGAAEGVYSAGQSLRQALSSSQEPREIRRKLANDVPGLGPKQASLFLRNVGFASNLAVLDVHVLTYMNWFCLTDEPVLSVSGLRRYEMLEEAFVRHSRSLGHSPDQFDVAVWIVVRTARREFTDECRHTCIRRI